MSVFEQEKSVSKAGSATPLPVGLQPSSGSSNFYAREDHKHILSTEDVEWTPVFSSASNPQPVMTNATRNGNYSIIGKKLFFEFYFSLGAATTMGTSTFYMSPPISATLLNTTVLTRVATYTLVGHHMTYDGATPRVRVGSMLYDTSLDLIIFYTHDQANPFSPTAPHTWISGDTLRGNGWLPLL